MATALPAAAPTEKTPPVAERAEKEDDFQDEEGEFV